MTDSSDESYTQATSGGVYDGACESEEVNSSGKRAAKEEPKEESATSSKRKKLCLSSNSERWEEMFEHLKRFKKMHNHCSVPNRYPEDPSLGCWVSTQRRQYKKALLKPGEGLAPDRQARLEALGFEWTGENPRHKNWDLRFAELQEFKKKYGHAQVPISWPENTQLANWTSTQRQEYKNLLKGKPSRLNEKRINLLNEIGFAWELQRGGRRRRVTVASDGSDHDSSSDSTAKAKSDDGAGPAAAVSTRGTSVVLPGVAILGGGSAYPRVKSPENSTQSLPPKTRAPGQVALSSPTRKSQLKQTPSAASTSGEASNFCTQETASAAATTTSLSATTISSSSATTSSVQSNSMADQYRYGISSGTRTAISGVSGEATNAIQALVRAQLLARDISQPSAFSNLSAYQQALALLTNQRNGIGLNLSGTMVNSSLSSRPVTSSPATLHALLAQERRQDSYFGHQYGLLSGPPNVAPAGFTSSAILQAAAALLQPQSITSNQGFDLSSLMTAPPASAPLPTMSANQIRDLSSLLDISAQTSTNRATRTDESSRTLHNEGRHEGPPDPK